CGRRDEGAPPPALRGAAVPGRGGDSGGPLALSSRPPLPPSHGVLPPRLSHAHPSAARARPHRRSARRPDRSRPRAGLLEPEPFHGRVPPRLRCPAGGFGPVRDPFARRGRYRPKIWIRFPESSWMMAFALWFPLAGKGPYRNGTPRCFSRRIVSSKSATMTPALPRP